jgi:hypothetical protein
MSLLSKIACASFALAAFAPVAHSQCLDWSDGFGLPGTDGEVLASTVFDDGSSGGAICFIGGQFQVVGDRLASGVARWTGDRWEPLGAGLGGIDWPIAFAFAAFDDGAGPALCVGGMFYEAGGVPASNIARWNGKDWSALGAGIGGGVHSLAVFDDGQGAGPCLYAGGLFLEAGGAPAAGIARWDGARWSPVGGGLSGYSAKATALCVHDDGTGPSLFVGGSFQFAGGVYAPGLARWDGNLWHAVGSGFEGVDALASYNDGTGRALYAGGTGIARWDGRSWSALGSGVEGWVRTLTVHDDGTGQALYVGGVFSKAGGLPAQGLAQWRDGIWSALGAGVLGPYESGVAALSSFVRPGQPTPVLVAGGRFYGAGTIAAANVAIWDGVEWLPAAEGAGLLAVQLHGGAEALAEFDDGTGPALYVAGDLESAGSAILNDLGLARRVGSDWQAVPECAWLFGPAQCLAVFDPGTGPGLFVGVSGNGVAMWNGRSWDPTQQIGTHGSQGGVHAMAVHDDGTGPALYIGGDFTVACPGYANGILRWNGTSCSKFEDSPGWVRALASLDDGAGPALYASGIKPYFGPPFFARWDGSSWQDLSADSATVGPLVAFDDGSGMALYAGGSFRGMGGAWRTGVARWSGSHWIPVGGPFEGSEYGGVAALVVHDDGTGLGPRLYAAGAFDHVGGTPVSSIASWNGSGWQALGAGLLDAGVAALLSFDDETGPQLYAAGWIEAAGPHVSVGIARWSDECGCSGTIYCSAKPSSIGCVPAIASSGTSSLSSPLPMVLSATQVPSHKSGLLLYGTNGPDVQPFQGGTLCARSPLHRTLVQGSGGNPPPEDCSGSFALDFKAYALSGVDPNLVAGASVNAQYWFRDGGDPHGSGLSDAVAFTLCE